MVSVFLNLNPSLSPNCSSSGLVYLEGSRERELHILDGSKERVVDVILRMEEKKKGFFFFFLRQDV